MRGLITIVVMTLLYIIYDIYLGAMVTEVGKRNAAHPEMQKKLYNWDTMRDMAKDCIDL